MDRSLIRFFLTPILFVTPFSARGSLTATVVPWPSRLIKFILPAMPLDDSVGDAQPEPPVRKLFRGKKWFIEIIRHIFSDPGAAILYIYECEPRIFFGGHMDLSEGIRWLPWRFE